LNIEITLIAQISYHIIEVFIMIAIIASHNF